jgi:methylated-DNA-[protein]-cysteine S-methyltransferase
MDHRTNVVVDSPVGPLALVAEDDTLVGLYMNLQRHRPSHGVLGGPGDPAEPPFTEAARQLGEYFAGERTDFDLLLRLRGTPFQQQVWAGLRQIPYGEVMSYGKLAERVGKPGAARAVGLANGRNPISIVVPCHRVIGASGGLTGYGGGIERKKHLLDLERGVRTGQLTLTMPG